MLNFLKKLNTNLNLFQSLSKKLSAFVAWLKQRKLLTAFLVILLLGGGYFIYQRLRPKSPQELYQLATVSQQDLKKVVNAPGVIKSETEVDLKFQASGQLTWVGVKEGDQVNKWQAIASLDTRELQKTLEKYLRDYSKERNDFEEDRQVTYRDVVLTDTIKRLLEKNQWDLDKTILDVELKHIALQYATLISPINGIVTHIDVPVGGVNITPATAVFTVADPTHLIFEAEVDETDIGFVSASQSAELILDAYPDETLVVTVDSVDFSSTIASDGSTVFLAQFQLNNSDMNRFRLGMNGEVNIVVAQTTTLAVPIQAVLEKDNLIVRVLDDNQQVVDQVVTTGLETDDFIEITSGLQPGQTIIVSDKGK